MKSLPNKPNLEFLKKQAKQLRSLHRQRDVSCSQRLRKIDSSFSEKADDAIFDARFSINDAQRAIAREYGYTSWAKLKHYIESLTAPEYNGVNDKQAYHQVIVDSYDVRSKNYDNSEWHRKVALQTVDYCPPDKGNDILDIATGTGTIAFHAADLTGPAGSVVGIDIARGMLAKCNEKLAATNHNNLRFMYADAEDLPFPDNSFDRIYCSSAFFWMSHPLAALRHWFELLKPGGVLGINSSPEDAFLWGGGARRALGKFGIEFTCNTLTGTREKCRQLVELAGFENVHVHEINDGWYVSVEDAKGPPLTVDAYAPGQHPHPLTGVPEDILQKVQDEYEADVDRHATEQGVWHDLSMYYVYGKKI